MNDKFFDLKSDKQDRIINASLHLFAVNGYKHASTDDIIKEAGISKGLLFHYFESKQGLYLFLIDYSVRYLLFEYDRAIGSEKEYFAFHGKLEAAKNNVLRNYPYMYGFIVKAIDEPQIGLRELQHDAINKYTETMLSYRNRLVLPELKDGVDMSQIETLINYTVEGLTKSQLEQDMPDADLLFNQVDEYIRLIEKLSVK